MTADCCARIVGWIYPNERVDREKEKNEPNPTWVCEDGWATGETAGADDKGVPAPKGAYGTEMRRKRKKAKRDGTWVPPKKRKREEMEQAV